MTRSNGVVGIDVEIPSCRAYPARIGRTSSRLLCGKDLNGALGLETAEFMESRVPIRRIRWRSPPVLPCGSRRWNGSQCHQSG